MSAAICWVTEHPVRTALYVALVCAHLGAGHALWKTR